MIRESGATTNGGEPRPFFDFLESSLRHKSESVIFEAARAICNLKDVSTRELTPAITLLQLFLSNNKPVVRFAAVRTLNKARLILLHRQIHTVAVRGRCWHAHQHVDGLSAGSGRLRWHFTV